MIKIFDKMETEDAIAILVLICGLYLISRGIDKTIGGIVSMVVGYYFGRRRPAKEK